MSGHVTSRVWDRVVCIVSPGTGRHRAQSCIERLQRELAESQATNELLSQKLSGVLEVSGVGPQLDLRAVETTVSPVPSTPPVIQHLGDERPEERTQPIDMRVPLAHITVRPLSDLARLGMVPPQRNSTP